MSSRRALYNLHQRLYVYEPFNKKNDCFLTHAALVMPQASWRQSPPTATRETITMATSRLVSLSRPFSGTRMTVTIATSQFPSTTKGFETGVKTSTTVWTPTVPTILPRSTISKSLLWKWSLVYLLTASDSRTDS